MLIGLCLIFTLVFFYFFFTRVEGLRGKNTMSQSINKQASNNQEKQASNKQKQEKPPRKKQKLPRKKQKQPSIKPYYGINHMGQSSNLNLNSI